jgi:hypothetical protein
MTTKFAATLTAFACTLLASTSLASAAEVTPQRLLNPEPQNGAERNLWNIGSVHLGSREFHHLAPLFGFVGDELPKVSR